MKEERHSSENKWRIIIILPIILGGLGVLGWVFMSRTSPAFAIEDWVGTWQVEYAYNNAPDIKYKGVLEVQWQDSLSGTLELKLPKGKMEYHDVREFTFDAGNGQLTGFIVHENYIIGGGHPKESLHLELETTQQFKGMGHCIAFCAKGTSGAIIHWTGTKLFSKK